MGMRMLKACDTLAAVNLNTHPNTNPNLWGPDRLGAMVRAQLGTRLGAPKGARTQIHIKPFGKCCRACLAAKHPTC